MKGGKNYDKNCGNSYLYYFCRLNHYWITKSESLEKLDVKELERRALEQYFLNENIVNITTIKTDVKADGRHAKYYDVKNVKNKVHKGFYDFWEKQWENK